MPIEVIFAGNKKVNARIDGFLIETDQAVHAGGDASAPQPFTLFLASLATCAGIYVKSFCDQRNIPTDAIHLTMETVKDPLAKMIARIEIRIHVPMDFPEKYEQAVINAAELCAVKRHLSEKIEHDILIVRE
jgi:putative redox protein